MSEKLQQAVAAYQAGDKKGAHGLLVELLQADPRNEQGWLLMARLLKKPEQRQKALENVLKLNPNNSQARRDLAALQPQPTSTPKDETVISKSPPPPVEHKQEPSLTKTRTPPAPPPVSEDPPGDLPPLFVDDKIALYEDFYHPAGEILAAMKQARPRLLKALKTLKRKEFFFMVMKVIAFIIWGGVFFIGFAFAGSSLFGVLGMFVGAVIGLGIGALGSHLFNRWRDAIVGEKGGFDKTKFDLVYSLLRRLKDDHHPKRTVNGFLDMTGLRQPAKLDRQKRSPSGWPVYYYKDEWLHLRLRLVDGNRLHISLIDRLKIKEARRTTPTTHRYQLRLILRYPPGKYQIDGEMTKSVLSGFRWHVEPLILADRLSFKTEKSNPFTTPEIMELARLLHRSVG
jgi:hypothetical protein